MMLRILSELIKTSEQKIKEWLENANREILESMQDTLWMFPKSDELLKQHLESHLLEIMTNFRNGYFDNKTIQH